METMIYFFSSIQKRSEASRFRKLYSKDLKVTGTIKKPNSWIYPHELLTGGSLDLLRWLNRNGETLKTPLNVV